MNQKTTLPKRRRKNASIGDRAESAEGNYGSHFPLDEIETPKSGSGQSDRLLKSWLNDESGYDEETWPNLKEALDRERDPGRVPEAV